VSNFEIISILLSSTALVISLVSIVRSRKTQADFLKLEKVHAELSRKQLDEIELNESKKGKTQLAIFIQDGNIILSNEGSVKAKDIELEFSKDEDNKLVGGEWSKLPYPILNPSEQFKLVAAYDNKQASPIFAIKVKWTNHDGSKGKYEGVLQP
jgi:hypothetical protein